MADEEEVVEERTTAPSLEKVSISGIALLAYRRSDVIFLKFLKANEGQSSFIDTEKCCSLKNRIQD